MAELVKCTVTGPCPITGADGRDVVTGNTVELDPTVTNIQALVYGGHVELANKTAERRVEKAQS